MKTGEKNTPVNAGNPASVIFIMDSRFEADGVMDGIETLIDGGQVVETILLVPKSWINPVFSHITLSEVEDDNSNGTEFDNWLFLTTFAWLISENRMENEPPVITLFLIEEPMHLIQLIPMELAFNVLFKIVKLLVSA